MHIVSSSSRSARRLPTASLTSGAYPRSDAPSDGFRPECLFRYGQGLQPVFGFRDMLSNKRFQDFDRQGVDAIGRVPQHEYPELTVFRESEIRPEAPGPAVVPDDVLCKLVVERTNPVHADRQPGSISEQLPM